MKTIYLKQEFPADHLLGQFVDETHYDVLVEEDCDVYKPLKGVIGEENGEHNVLLKFRKGVFSDDLIAGAYRGLKDAAVESQNRGTAAGPRYEKATGRDWVTSLQEDVLDTLSGSMTTVFGDDPIESLYAKYKREDKMLATKGRVWLTKQKPENFDFDRWASQVKAMPMDLRIKEVDMVQQWISDTQYANPVFSGIAGYFDRYPRIPYCRTTSFTQNNISKFDEAVPFIEGVSEHFKQLLPGRYLAQKEAMSHLDAEFRIGNSVYTTVTVNKNYRTAAHRDAGDLAEGFGNLTVVWDGLHDWEGCYLVFPAYRVAVNVRPGDVLMADVHEIHGNTPIYPVDASGNHGRISLVCYMREKMADCKTKAYEDTRLSFINSRKHLTSNNTGVTPGMWESEEWYQYLMNNGLHEYAEEVVSVSTNALDI